MKRKLPLILAILCLTAPTLLAQTRMPGATPSGLDATLLKLFGDIKSFTATSQVRVGQPGRESLIMPLNVALLDGKIRSEVDVTKAEGAELPPQAAAQLKQMGMGRIISITNPGRKTKLLIYPDTKSYVEEPFSAEEAASYEKDPKIEKTVLGKETIDNHPCEKTRVTITGDDGQKQEILVWNASDLKGFPVKVQVDADGTTVTILNTNVQLTKPAAKLYAAPEGYTKYASQMEYMQKFMMGGGMPK